MKQRTWPLTSNAHATTRLAAAFGAGLVGEASVGCAPAAAAPVVVPAVVRTAGPSNVPRQASNLCAVPTREQELAAAHAAVREALVSNKKAAIRASYQGAVILRSAESAQGGSPPGEPQNVDEGRNSEAEDAKLESALAAVDADESHGKGPV